MSEDGLELERQEFSCRLCSDLLQEPVTIPCGHSFCRECVQSHWDGEDRQPPHTCPQCRTIFSSRPPLFKNAMLETLMERLKTLLPAEDSYAAPGEIPCDVCPGRKLRAAKSCLSCRVTYCENHLRPHHDVPQFKKHKLVEPRDSLEEKENICSLHDEVINMFCRNNNQNVCPLCAADEHKGHEVSWTEAESARLQEELEERRQKIKMRIGQKEKELEELRQTAAGLSSSADTALQLNQETFTQMIKLMEEKKSSAEQQIRSHQHISLTDFRMIEDQIKEDIAFWTKQHAVRESLIVTQHNPYHFLRKTSALPLIPPPQLARKLNSDMSSFRKIVLNKPQIPMSVHVLCVYYDARLEDVFNNVPREGLKKYGRKITWDLNTAHRNITLEPTEDGKQCASFTARPKYYPDHPDRFTDCVQVLSKEPLTGQCYFEVCITGGCFIGLAYKSIERKGKGKQCTLGLNNKSWACYGGGFNTKSLGSSGTCVLCPNLFNTVGVFLDYDAGSLIIYLMRSSTLFDIFRVETEFTEPLYFGASFLYPGDRIYIPDLNDRTFC